MAGKYTPLERYLRALPPSQREDTLPFAQIERILNDELPPSAYNHQAWWSNQVKKGSHKVFFAVNHLVCNVVLLAREMVGD